ncbi:hypothetical protein BA190_09485 [Labrys sp. WJW]|uniref:hypothetical protein n=1 Tax=Labrys sp. WJW TaxID=1737983 RepID=UPI00082CE4A4|nr:hypothetical protein [Labrys sp. WJW]OCC05138.1 hypothetical protein BA190_09485 [Labrys sp. WJW]
MPRASNPDLCEAFRALLTTGFHAEGIAHADALAATKPWRGELWRAFREIEARLCPTPPRPGEAIDLGDDDEG